MYMTKESIMNRLKEHYNAVESSADQELFGIFLRGSQNYIDTKFLETSDVDSVAVLLPTKRELVLGIDSSRKDLSLNDEKISRFDVRKLFQLFNKSSIVNFEVLFTEYFIVNEKYIEYYNELVKMRESIARLDEKKFLMSTNGESSRRMKSIKRKDDYKKELANILRLNATVKAYIAGKDFKDCLKAMDEEFIYKIRTTDLYSYDEAIQLAEVVDNQTRISTYEFKNEGGKNVNEHRARLDDLLVEIVSVSMGKYGK